MEGTNLYQAATESLVADASGASTFEKMLQEAVTQPTLEFFLNEVKATEVLIRADFEIVSMPTAWRSAKSVITTALKLSIPLTDDNNVCYGKTWLQTKIKEAKAATKDPMSEEQYIEKILIMLRNVPAGIDSIFVRQQVKIWLS